MKRWKKRVSARWGLAQVDAAVASLLEPEISIKRLLLLLEMARQGVDQDAQIPVLHWNQVLRDLAP